MTKGNRLIKAVRKGDVALVKDLIKRGEDANVSLKRSKITPLMEAVSKKNLELVQLLLEAGVDVNCQAKNGRTALSWAKGIGNKKIIEQLEKKGAKGPVKEDTTAPQDENHCAFCNKELSHKEKKEHYCLECEATYCDTHYPWSNWEGYDHMLFDKLERKVMCPFGHIQHEYDE